MNRPDKDIVLKRLRRQFEKAKAHLPEQPCDLQLKHIEQVLRVRGLNSRGARKRPDQRSFWNGLWRAIIFDCDDYRCYFCGRSAEEGVHLEGTPLVLRLELDHVDPRSRGGHDYVVSNVRTTCRTCNVARGRLSEHHFRAELLSLARAVGSGAHIG
jgi:5-methylcytosine-specific restriction endonuclease McrA